MGKSDDLLFDGFREKELENMVIKNSKFTKANLMAEESPMSWEDRVKMEIDSVNLSGNLLIEKLLLEAYDRMFLKYWIEEDREFVLSQISSSLRELIEIGISDKKENKKIFQRKLDKEIDKWMEEFIHNGGLGVTVEYMNNGEE